MMNRSYGWTHCNRKGRAARISYPLFFILHLLVDTDYLSKLKNVFVLLMLVATFGSRSVLVDRLYRNPMIQIDKQLWLASFTPQLSATGDLGP